MKKERGGSGRGGGTEEEEEESGCEGWRMCNRTAMGKLYRLESRENCWEASVKGINDNEKREVKGDRGVGGK